MDTIDNTPTFLLGISILTAATVDTMINTKFLLASKEMRKIKEIL